MCVDDTGATLQVSPDTVYAWDTHPQDKGPVTILWFTATGAGNLQIKPDSDECMKNVWCSPSTGHCRATTRPLEGKGEARCKYDVWIEGGRQPRLDPYVIVQPCCP